MAALGLSAVAAASCGGSGASLPPNCLQALPCGGDVVGSWSLVGGCADVGAQTAQIQEFCPGASLNGYGVSMSGTLTFDADFSYRTSTWNQSFAASLRMAPSCLGAASCEDASETVVEELAGMRRSQVTSCSGTTTCTCYTSGTVSLDPDVGTWQTVGTFLQMLGSSTTAANDYCVEGDRLHLLTLAASGAILTDMVAVRQ